MPVKHTGPLQSFSDDFSMRLMARLNSIADILHPVIIPFSKKYQFEYDLLDVALILKFS